MQALRTPDERFSNLLDYPFSAHYLHVADERYGELRMHYIDEGPRDAQVIVLYPSQGAWVYMYRHMITVLVAAGYRVIAPDYIGFGRSDKLRQEEDYEFNRHIEWNTSFLQQLNISNAIGFMFDWGGFFGLRIAAENPEIFSKLVLLNTQLPTGEASAGHAWFIKWREVQLSLPVFPQGEMVQEGTVKTLPAETVAAYDAPYPDQSYRTGPRRFPMILPISHDSPARPANLAAWDALANWNKPVLTLFSKQFEGSAMGPGELIKHIPGCKGQAHALIDKASFYIVEDQSLTLCGHLLTFAGAD